MNSAPYRLRIASVYRSFNRSGSIESLFSRNAERLAQDEDLTVFAAAATRTPTSAPLRFVTVEPVVRGRDRARYALECASFAHRASKALSERRGDFDVVHVEGFAAYDADLVTVHAVRRAEMEHYFAHVEHDARRLRRGVSALARPQTAVVKRIERRLLERPSPPYCICPSRAVKRDLERWHGVPPERIEVLPYGVEVERFRRDEAARDRLRAEHGTPADGVVVLFVGSSFERKGLRVAIDGLARSRLAGAELWAIGGTEPERREAERSARAAGVRIRLFGKRPAAELPAFYSAADVFVLPSQQDSWAIPVTEALAAGCAVVTSEYTGSCDLIDHGVSGYVLRGAGSADELAALLEGPLANLETCAAIGTRGREAVLPHDYEAFYTRYRAAHHHAYELAREGEGR